MIESAKKRGRLPLAARTGLRLGALIFAGRSGGPRPAFEIGAAAGSFLLRNLATVLKLSVGKFRRKETPEILPDCSQTVRDFLIDSGHCFSPFLGPLEP
jgi:hypothetical protein